MPVEMSSAAPGGSVSGAARQARKSMPAEPAVAGEGSGNSRPMRGSRILSLTVGRIESAANAAAAQAGARVRHCCADGLRTTFARTAPRGAVGGRQALGDQGNEFARDVELRRTRDLEFSAGPQDRQGVVLAIECDPIADLVGGDQVELLALELTARVFLDVVGL